MIINIREVFEGAVDSQPISVTIPADELWQTGAAFTEGVGAEGADSVGADGVGGSGGIDADGFIENRSGIVTLKLQFTADVREACDRCLDTFNRRYVFQSEHILITDENDNEEYLTVDGVHLNITDVAVDEFLLMHPAKILCKEDCPGLDPETGAKL
jgi:uncharacterized protein